MVKGRISGTQVNKRNGSAAYRRDQGGVLQKQVDLEPSWVLL
eukprot:CAMPEP_0114310700 /NCGR_PEP_ID=MMETSP0059-20121206/19399_1 /TAXON_ID=36894 /ORGANISM="Pyramimonas parkeae, Strain CCMP726" /LENGTH=41 /DNA_ID= /DNA_START= /DNA_END= /DNA_ORIENTATION=